MTPYCDPPPTALTAGDTTLQRKTFARELASYEALVLVQARLRTIIIASILPADLVALRDPVHADLLLDIPTIMAHVALIHGSVTAEDLSAWKAALLEQLSSRADFLKHAALFAETRYRSCTSKNPSRPRRCLFYETNPNRKRYRVSALVAHGIKPYSKGDHVSLCWFRWFRFRILLAKKVPKVSNGLNFNRLGLG
jgi:hypothetical protein